MPQGLGIEARLIGADDELEGWRRRFDAGLMVGLSIGFRTAMKPIWGRSTLAGVASHQACPWGRDCRGLNRQLSGL